MMHSGDTSERCLAGLPARPVIGMIHVQALPGTPHAHLNLDQVVRRAVAEATVLREAGFDALLIENMHDRPYLRRQVGPEIVAAMTAVGVAVRSAVDCPIGVQILAGANREALAVALACGAMFIRVEGFVFAHVADEGAFPEADAGKLLRYRREIGADHIAIVADIRKKHSSHAWTADLDIAEWARAAEFFGADALIVTGLTTGCPANPDDVNAAVAATARPVWVGSGVNLDNVESFWGKGDGFIIGSSIKQGGIWSEVLDSARIAALMAKVRVLRADPA